MTRARRGGMAAVAVALVAVSAGPAAAHPLDLATLRLDVRGDEVAIALELDAAGAAALVAADPLGFDDPAAAARAAALADATFRQAALETDRGPCRFDGATAGRTGPTVTIQSRALCPAGVRALRWPMPLVAGNAVPTTFQILVKVDGLGAARVTVVDRHHPVLSVGDPVAIALADFVWMGVEHIGVAPSEWTDGEGGLALPDGIDHILFLVALLLGGGTLVQLLGVASGFTIGHSITLALAAFGVVQLPERLVESVIALSIALVAVEAMSGRLRRHRWTMAALFGMVHGFGFAGALTELELSGAALGKALVGYNLGVELGQLAIVLAAVPVMVAVRRCPRLRRFGGHALAIAIACAGVVWFFDRACG